MSKINDMLFASMVKSFSLTETISGYTHESTRDIFAMAAKISSEPPFSVNSILSFWLEYIEAEYQRTGKCSTCEELSMRQMCVIVKGFPGHE